MQNKHLLIYSSKCKIIFALFILHFQNSRIVQLRKNTYHFCDFLFFTSVLKIEICVKFLLEEEKSFYLVTRLQGECNAF